MVAEAWLGNLPTIIVKAFKKCGVYNATDGTIKMFTHYYFFYNENRVHVRIGGALHSGKYDIPFHVRSPFTKQRAILE